MGVETRPALWTAGRGCETLITGVSKVLELMSGKEGSSISVLTGGASRAGGVAGIRINDDWVRVNKVPESCSCEEE